MMQILKMYNLFWKYDGTTLRIEHYDYWQSLAGLDLQTQKISEAANKYSYINDERPKYEKFSFMEAGDSNYTQHTIKYNSACADPEHTSEYSNKVTTDLQYIIDCGGDPDLVSNVSDDGWVILASYLSGADYFVYYGNAYENAISSYNYVNSWSYLLRALFLHGRVELSGYINFTAIDFISIRKLKQQNINAIVCHEDDYDPEDISQQNWVKLILVDRKVMLKGLL